MIVYICSRGNCNDRRKMLICKKLRQKDTVSAAGVLFCINAYRWGVSFYAVKETEEWAKRDNVA